MVGTHVKQEYRRSQTYSWDRTVQGESHHLKTSVWRLGRKSSCRAFAWPVPDPGCHPQHCHRTKHRELPKWVNFTKNKKYSGARWQSQLVGRLRQEDRQLEASWSNLETLSLNRMRRDRDVAQGYSMCLFFIYLRCSGVKRVNQALYHQVVHLAH